MSALESRLAHRYFAEQSTWRKAKAEAVYGAGRGSEAMMGKLLRRIRGAIGMGFTWAVACGFLGGIPHWVFGVYTDAPLPILFGAFGFVAGVTFSGILALTEGRRRFDQMSLRRFAGWGAAGGLLLSALWARAMSLGWGEALALASAFSLVSAVFASGSLALARRAVSRELPDPHGDTAEPALTDAEKQKLL